MREKAVAIFKVCFPAIAIVMVCTIFFSQLRYAQRDMYVFRINLHRPQYMVVNGKDSIGQVLSIDGGTVRIDEEAIHFNVQRRWAEWEWWKPSYNILFDSPHRPMVSGIHGISGAYVRFYASAPNSSFFSSMPSEHSWELLMSVFNIHFRLIELRRALALYSILLLLTTVAGYSLYLKPTLLSDRWKVTWVEDSTLKFFGLLIVVGGGLGLFLLL